MALRFVLQLRRMDPRNLIEVRECIEYIDTQNVTFQGREFPSASIRIGDKSWSWCVIGTNPVVELTRRFRSHEAAFRARGDAFVELRKWISKRRRRRST